MYNPFSKNSRFLKAAIEVQTEQLESMIESGQDVTVADEFGHTALHYISYAGKPDTIEKLVKAGANINAQTPAKETPLIKALRNCKTDNALMLLKLGADVNVVTVHNTTALSCAVKFCSGMIAPLIKAGAKTSVGADGAVILLAIERRYWNGVDALLETNPDVNITGRKGQRPLQLAIDANNLPLVQRLINAGADVNPDVHHHYGTPLWLAVIKHQSLPMAACLLDHGANPNIKIGQNSLLIDVIKRKHFAMANLLVEKGASTDVRDENNIPAKFYLDRENRKSTLAQAGTNDTTIDWTKTGNDRIMRCEFEPSLGKDLKDIFNFERRERLSMLSDPATGKIEAMTITGFDQMTDKDILKTAVKEFNRQGGKTDPAIIHHRLASRNKAPLI